MRSPMKAVVLFLWAPEQVGFKGAFKVAAYLSMHIPFIVCSRR
jgi:hypothetical protein